MDLKSQPYDVLILDEDDEIIINNEVVLNEQKNQSIKEYLRQEFRFKKYCPFCSSELIVKIEKEEELPPAPDEFSYDYL